MRDEAAILLGLWAKFVLPTHGELQMAQSLKLNQKCEIMGRRSVKRLTLVRRMIMEDPPENRSELPMFEQQEMTINEVALKASEDILSALPNDLTRLIYLASIRDYNSGTYRHPVLSRQFEATAAHQAFQACHQEVFARLIAHPVSKYVEQLEGYIRYSRAERSLLITSWKGLQAYRAAIPLRASKRACETFFLNVKTALTILELARERAQ